MKKKIILAVVIMFAAVATYAQVSVGLRIRLAPPPLPVYVQPPCPVDGYLWEPGYWAYDDADGYYWVPGTWVAPPDPGLLWTPSYWGWDDGYYSFHRGYWGPHVGFYGGINYGFGYPGVGFYGGVWSGRSFRYNTAVFNVNRTVIRNTYVSRPTFRPAASRASFNGPGGINRRPTAGERGAMAERHVQPTHMQQSHQQMAGRNPAQHFSSNHGRPGTSAVNRVNENAAHATGNAAAHHMAPTATRAAESHRGPAANHEMNRPQMQNRQPMQHQQHMPMQQPHAEQHQPMHMGGGEMRGGGAPPHMGGGGSPHMGGGQMHMGGGGPPHMGGGGGGGHMGGGGGEHHR